MFCAASAGELKLFKDQDASAFTDDKAVTVFVEWTTGVGGVLVAGGEGLHRSEATDTRWE